MSQFVQQLISEGEHQQLDFKFEISDTQKIARTLVAFANTDGGRLLVGVKDNGVIAGVRSEEEYYMVDAAAKMHCTPPVVFSVKEWPVGKKTVLEVVVRKSAHRPHFVIQEEGKKVAYIRVKDQNFVVNRVLLRVWEKEHTAQGVYLRFTDAEKLLLSTLEEGGSLTLAEFSKLARIGRNKAETILVKLMLLKMIDITFSENETTYSLSRREGVSGK
jgi:predicted HTH transcriptional regulator